MICCVLFLIAGVIFLGLSIFGENFDLYGEWFLPAALGCIFAANFINIFMNMRKKK